MPEYRFFSLRKSKVEEIHLLHFLAEGQGSRVLTCIKSGMSERGTAACSDCAKQSMSMKCHATLLTQPDTRRHIKRAAWEQQFTPRNNYAICAIKLEWPHTHLVIWLEHTYSPLIVADGWYDGVMGAVTHFFFFCPKEMCSFLRVYISSETYTTYSTCSPSPTVF